MTGKKILTCLLAFCMLAGAAGCGQRAADETDKTASGGAGEAALEAEAAEASPAEDFPEAALEAEAAEAGSLLQETEEVVDCRPIHQE